MRGKGKNETQHGKKCAKKKQDNMREIRKDWGSRQQQQKKVNCGKM
jgi:hypothetical protein